MHAVAWNATTPYRPCLYLVYMKMCAAGRLAILNSALRPQACPHVSQPLLSAVPGSQLSLSETECTDVQSLRSPVSGSGSLTRRAHVQPSHASALTSFSSHVSALRRQAVSRVRALLSAGLRQIRYGKQGSHRSSKPD